MLIGHARGSTADQNPRLQLDALTAAGAERIFTDHGVSGSRASRPELDRMLEHLREGDTVVVTPFYLPENMRRVLKMRAIRRQLTGTRHHRCVRAAVVHVGLLAAAHRGGQPSSPGGRRSGDHPRPARA